MIWKNQCLAIFCIWGWNVPYKKKINKKTTGNWAFSQTGSQFVYARAVDLRTTARKGEKKPSMETTVRVWLLLVSGFSCQLMIWWRQSPVVTFHFLSNAGKIRLWALNFSKLTNLTNLSDAQRAHLNVWWKEVVRELENDQHVSPEAIVSHFPFIFFNLSGFSTFLVTTCLLRLFT